MNSSWVNDIKAYTMRTNVLDIFITIPSTLMYF